MRRVAASSPPPPNPACHRPLPVFALPAPAGAAPLPAGIASAPSDRRRAFLLPPQSHVGLGSPPANRTVLSWSSSTGRIQTLCPRPRTGLRRTDLQTVTPLVGRFGHDEPQGGPIRQGRGLSPPVTLLSASRSSRNVHPSAHGVRPCCGGLPTKHGD